MASGRKASHAPPPVSGAAICRTASLGQKGRDQILSGTLTRDRAVMAGPATVRERVL